MKRKLAYFVMIVAGTFLLSCKKDSVRNISTISYGTSFGMCVDYCLRDINVSSNKVTYTKAKNGANPDLKTCSNHLDEAEFIAIKELLEDAKFNNLPERIGCPDCADGGAEWIEIKGNEKSRKVVFEYNNAPDELKAAVVKLRALAAGFSNCN